MRGALAALVLPVVVGGCSSGNHAQAACASGQLGVFAVTEGGGGTTVGEFQLRNNGSAPCWLRGRPQLSVLDARGHLLGINALPPKRRSAVRLGPHDAALVTFQWHNWCRLTAPAAWRLVLPHGGGTIKSKADIGRPRCDDSKSPSTLVISTFGPPT